MKKLKILSIGAGAIGTYIGGSLTLRGHDLAFVEKPQFISELARQGLILSLENQEYHIPHPKVFGSVVEALSSDNYDVALFALKSFDTAGFAQSLDPVNEKFPAILCLSNGISNESILGKTLGKDRVIPGTITSAVGRRGLGNIILEKRRGVGIAAGHPLSATLVNEFNSAQLNGRLIKSAASMKWSKMLTNIMANATSAILDMPPSAIFADPALYNLEIQQLREALAVMQKQGIKTINLPGTPIRLLGFVVKYLPVKISRPILKKAVGSGRGMKMPSFHIDLHSGRGFSEVDYLNGEVVRAGERIGIPTPINQRLNTILLKLTAGEIPLSAYQHNPQKLLSALKEYQEGQVTR